MSMGTSWKSVLPSKFLRPEDLPPGGKPMVVTIKKVRIEQFTARGFQGQTQTDSVMVADLYNFARPMKLNKRKCTILEALTGTEEFARWADKDIVIYAGVEEIYGEMKPSIIIESNPHHVQNMLGASAPPLPIAGVTTARALLDAGPARVLPLDAINRFRDTVSSFGGKTWDDWLRWAKLNVPEAYERCYGKDFESIPFEVTPAMKSYLNTLAEEQKAAKAPPPAPVVVDDSQIPF